MSYAIGYHCWSEVALLFDSEGEVTSTTVATTLSFGHAFHEVFCLLSVGTHHIGIFDAAFHKSPFHDAVPCTIGFEFSGLPLVGRCDPSFDVIDDWFLQSLYGSSSYGAGCSGVSSSGSSSAALASAAATRALAAAVVLRITHVKLQVAEVSIPACLTVRSMLGCSIPSTGIILLTKGRELPRHLQRCFLLLGSWLVQTI